MGLADIQRKNAALRAAGKLPGAKGTRAVRAAAVPLALCVHLGERVSGACGELARRCNLHGTTAAAYTRCPKAERHCPVCADFSPARAGGHRTGTPAPEPPP